MNALLFLLPAWWPALLLLPLLAAGAVVAVARARRSTDQLLGARAVSIAGGRVLPRARLVAEGLAVLLLGVALCHPAVPGDEGDAGAELAVCLDVSWSMAAADAAPSRLGAAQQELHALAAEAAGARVALVAFAGDAEVLAPATQDLDAVAELADELVPGAEGRAGTDPGAAIDAAVGLLRRAGRGGAVVVISDGEDFTGRAPAAAARALAAGFPVHTIGVGDPAGSKIPVAEAGSGAGAVRFLRGPRGDDIVTRLEADHLRELARAGGGRYAAYAPGVLRTLHDDTLLPAARAAAVRAGRLRPMALHAWPLLVALLLWMLRWCVPERRT